ncbi:MAG: LacI family DNA-binding transcriptional regulator [Limnochordales bacterium]|nr:LacI family DNA-binding transcriptional regulator [Limnochordales bacterium]
MVTIKDIAKLSGVSPATVSRILNGHPTVSPELRERVLQLARELNYQPNAVARSLVSSRSRLLGVVIPDISNPFFPDVVRAVEDVAAQHGYSVLLSNTDWNLYREKESLGILRSRQVDGIVLVPSQVEPHLDWLTRSSIPVALLTRTNPSFDSVETDHFRGGYLVAKHLVDLGHTHMAVIGDTCDPKYKGFREGLIDAQIPVATNLYSWQLSKNDATQEGAYQLTLQKMREFEQLKQNRAQAGGMPTDQQLERPTAIFAQNDLMAIGVLMALEELGVKVPEEMAVVGFDNIRLAAAVRPALTTVAQPSYELGRIATELLIERIESRREIPPRHIVLEPRLVVRGSTTRLRQQAPVELSSREAIPDHGSSA